MKVNKKVLSILTSATLIGSLSLSVEAQNRHQQESSQLEVIIQCLPTGCGVPLREESLNKNNLPKKDCNIICKGKVFVSKLLSTSPN